MTSRYVITDVFDGLASLEPASVDLIVTSPPFLALRSYLPADHEHKAKELGSEATPGEFLNRLLDVVEACARVLAPHGSLVFELGDTYAGSERGGDAFLGTENGGHVKKPNVPMGKRDLRGWPLDKSKVLIPQLFAIALAYGFNPLTGRQTEPWRVRNTVAWCRPNPPVGRDGDKFRPATSFLTVACKARDRYWDGDAVRVPHARDYAAEGRQSNGTPLAKGVNEDRGDKGRGMFLGDPAGAPLLDFWTIPTAPYKGAHYATYPPDLVVPLVKAMCPQRVCRVCGMPSRRIVDSESSFITGDVMTGEKRVQRGVVVGSEALGHGNGKATTHTTLGWSDCGHDSWRPGLVLDPFAGSGTTLAVASGHGLDSVGFDLDERNAWLARERIGMFVEVVSGSDTR